MVPVRRVDVHEDDAGARRRVLDEDPLGAVGAPDTDPVTWREPAADERAGEPVDRRVERRVGHVHVLVPGHERVRVGNAARRRRQVFADRLVEERDVGGSRRVRQRHGAHGSPGYGFSASTTHMAKNWEPPP